MMRNTSGTPSTANLATVNRVVHGHDWRDLSEWVTMVEGLADLTDDQIEEVINFPAIS